MVGEQLFLKAYRRLRARRASRVGARPLPHGALALRRRRADGRRHRARAAVGRAHDRRSRASGGTEPGRRLALHAALPRAQHRRRRGASDRRHDRPRRSLELPAARARAGGAHGRPASCARCADGRPELRSGAVHGANVSPNGPLRFAASSMQRCLALRARRGELPPDARDVGGQRARAAQRLHAAIEKHAAGPTTALAIRLHGDFHLGQVLVTQERFRHHGSRGRARPKLGGAAAQAHRAQRRGRDAALVRLRARRRGAAVRCKAALGRRRHRPVPRGLARACSCGVSRRVPRAIGDCGVWPRDEAEVERPA